MSAVLCISTINDCARAAGDPAFKTITRDQWAGILNEVARELCQRLMMRKRRGIFSLEANNAVYAYPSNLVQMISLWYNADPSNNLTWKKLDEKFEDEFQREVSSGYPTGDPSAYFADAEWINTLPMPTTDQPGCMRMDYWGLPTRVTDPAAEFLPIRDSAENILASGMLSRAFVTLEKYDRADREEQRYEKLITTSELRITDRSDDRRARLRARSIGYRGQV